MLILCYCSITLAAARPGWRAPKRFSLNLIFLNFPDLPWAKTSQCDVRNHTFIVSGSEKHMVIHREAGVEIGLINSNLSSESPADMATHKGALFSKTIGWNVCLI